MSEEQSATEKTKEKIRLRKLAEALQNLESNEDVVILEGLKKIKDVGDASAITHMARVLENNESPAVQKELESIFFNLKDSQVVGELIVAAEKAKQSIHKQFLIRSIWESGLEPESFYSNLIEFALTADYLTILEILTVIENMETQLNEDKIEAELKAVEEAKSNADAQNAALLEALSDVLKSRIIE